MNQWMTIPCLDQISQSTALANEYSCAFEYNDFISGSVLDDPASLDNLLQKASALQHSVRNTLHGVFYDITIFSSDPKIRAVSEQRVRQSMDAAARLGVKGVVFHTNYIPTFRAEPYQKLWVESNKQFWKKMIAEYPNTEIYMENMFDLEPELLLRLADELAEEERFGVCLDVAHAHLSEVPLKRWIKDLAPHIRHIHINDNDGKTDGHLPLGEGNICFEDVFQNLDKYCADVSILVEITGIEDQEKSFQYLERHCFLKQREGALI